MAALTTAEERPPVFLPLWPVPRLRVTVGGGAYGNNPEEGAVAALRACFPHRMLPSRPTAVGP